MAKSQTGSVSIFAGIKNVNTGKNAEEKEKKAVLTESAVEKEEKEPTAEVSTLGKTEPVLQENPAGSFENERNDATELETSDTEKAAAVPDENSITTTSIGIQQSSLNYLAYISKMQGKNRSAYLTDIIRKDLSSGESVKPDFFTDVEKVQKKNKVNRSFSIQASVLCAAKKRAIAQMKTLSDYVDDLLQEEIKNFS